MEKKPNKDFRRLLKGIGYTFGHTLPGEQTEMDSAYRQTLSEHRVKKQISDYAGKIMRRS